MREVATHSAPTLFLCLSAVSFSLSLLTVRVSRRLPLVTKCTPEVSIATPTRSTCSPMYLGAERSWVKENTSEREEGGIGME